MELFFETQDLNEFLTTGDFNEISKSKKIA